jgi:hypothetical protein
VLFTEFYPESCYDGSQVYTFLARHTVNRGMIQLIRSKKPVEHVAMLETKPSDRDALERFMDRLILFGLGITALAMVLLVLVGAV